MTMLDPEEREDPADIAMGIIMAGLVAIVFPTGAMSRIGTQLDRANAFHASFSPERLPLPSHRSTEALLRGFVSATSQLHDVREHLEMSMTMTSPTLGVLMERDVATGALGVASEQCMNAALEFGQAFDDNENEDEDPKGPLDALISAMAGKKSAISPKADKAVQEILGSLMSFDASGARVAYMHLKNNPWYLTVIESFAETIGIEVDMPSEAQMPGQIVGWRP